MKRRNLLRLSATLTFLAGLALQSCALQRHPPKPPQVTGSLADLECGGDTPTTLGPMLGEMVDPDAESIEAWLAKLAEQGDESARLRAYLQCLADQGTEREPGAKPN